MKTAQIFAMIKTEMQADGSFLVDDVSKSLWDDMGLEVSPEQVMRTVNTLRKQGNEITTTGNGWYRLVKTAGGVLAGDIYAAMN